MYILRTNGESSAYYYTKLKYGSDYKIYSNYSHIFVIVTIFLQSKFLSFSSGCKYNSIVGFTINYVV